MNVVLTWLIDITVTSRARHNITQISGNAIISVDIQSAAKNRIFTKLALCVGNPLVTKILFSQTASNAEIISIAWCQHWGIASEMLQKIQQIYISVNSSRLKDR